jgi:hypothetical protein
MRTILLISALLVSYSIYAQDSLLRTKHIFIAFSGGLPVVGNKDMVINDYKFESTDPFFAKLSINYIFKNGVGIYGSIKRIAYRYAFSKTSLQDNNPDFVLIMADKYINYSGTIYSLGLTYKFNYKRWLVFPNIGIGLRDFKNIYGGALLKKNNSNTMRKISNLSTITDNKTSLSMGLDVVYCFAKRFGATLVLDYDNFNPKLHSLLDITEYNYESRLEKNFNLKQNKILLAIGGLVKF